MGYIFIVQLPDIKNSKTSLFTGLGLKVAALW